MIQINDDGKARARRCRVAVLTPPRSATASDALVNRFIRTWRITFTFVGRDVERAGYEDYH